jgi:adenylate cyclase
MDKFDPTSLPDVPDIPASIVASGLSDAPLTTLIEIAMQRLIQSGVPIDRMNVGFRILHPLFDGMSITWTREAGAEVFYAALVDKEGSDFRLSPFYVMLSAHQSEWRLRLDRDPAAENFPLLGELRAKGFTDYLALIVAFGGATLHPQSLDGIATSWSTRSTQGFSASDIAAMRGVLTPLALVFRLAIKDQITKSALNTFHGPLVGGRILAGSSAAMASGSRLRSGTAICATRPASPINSRSTPFSTCSTPISIAPPAP